MQTNERENIAIFSLHAHEDTRHVQQVQDHLLFLKRDGLAPEWYDKDIQAGTDWEDALETCGCTTAILLFFVSPHFMASQYCHGVEMAKALELHREGKVCVVPILLQPGVWNTAPFASLAALPTGATPLTAWSNRQRAYENIAFHIANVVKTLVSKRPDETLGQPKKDVARPRPVLAKTTLLPAEHEPQQHSEQDQPILTGGSSQRETLKPPFFHVQPCRPRGLGPRRMFSLHLHSVVISFALVAVLLDLVSTLFGPLLPEWVNVNSPSGALSVAVLSLVFALTISSCLPFMRSKRSNA